MNSDYRPPDYLTPCAYCGLQHALKEERWECLGCGKTVCRQFANEGRKWHRRGELVHLLRIAGHRENPPFVKLCGTLRRVADHAPGTTQEPETPQPTEAQ